MKNNKSRVVYWHDEDCPDSYLLCAEEYGVKFIQKNRIGKSDTELVVYGPAENVNHFIDDYVEDCLEPMESMSIGIEHDEDYVAWLNNETNRLLVLEYLEDVFAPVQPIEKPEFEQTEFKF